MKRERVDWVELVDITKMIVVEVLFLKYLSPRLDGRHH
jgi:hypothetical protein